MKIPLQIAKHGRQPLFVYIMATVNDTKCVLIVDTGASVTALGAMWLSMHGKSKHYINPDKPIVFGGVKQAGRYALADIELTDNATSDKATGHEVAVIDMTPINEQFSALTGYNAAGIIGIDYLLERKAIIALQCDGRLGYLEIF